MKLTDALIFRWADYAARGNRFAPPPVTVGYEEHTGKGYRDNDYGPEIDEDVLVVDRAYSMMPPILCETIRVHYVTRGKITDKIPEQSMRNTHYMNLTTAKNSWQYYLSHIITKNHDTT